MPVNLWDRLPQELRHKIIRYFVQDYVASFYDGNPLPYAIFVSLSSTSPIPSVDWVQPLQQTLRELETEHPHIVLRWESAKIDLSAEPRDKYAWARLSNEAQAAPVNPMASLVPKKRLVPFLRSPGEVILMLFNNVLITLEARPTLPANTDLEEYFRELERPHEGGRVHDKINIIDSTANLSCNFSV